MAPRRVVTAQTAVLARLVVALLIVGATAPLVGRPVAAYPIDPDWAPPPTVFIPETGHTIDRLFLDLWRSGGGVWAFGNPITSEMVEPDGHVVQYYQYARFEYWPEGDANGNYVTLGSIGAELGPPMVPRRFAASRSAAVAVASAEARAWAPVTPEEVQSIATDEPSYRFVPETGHGVWGGFRSFWEATGEAAYLGNPLTEEYILDGVSYQVFDRGKLRWQEGEAVAMVPVGEALVERYGLPTAPEKQGDIPTYDEALFVPPVAVPDPDASPAPAPSRGRSVVVSLSEQALWAFDGNRVVRTSYISTGTEKFRTPPGLFYVNTKIDSQTMAGVLGGEYYNVPDVPYVMYFTDRGHALHGIYWHENFGEPMSHGCVNLPMDVAEWIYRWAPVGMPVLIVE